MRPTAAARSVKALVEANASHNVYTNGITAINLPAAGKAARVSFYFVPYFFHYRIYLGHCCFECWR